jgi:hypothetical protein
MLYRKIHTHFNLTLRIEPAKADEDEASFGSDKVVMKKDEEEGKSCGDCDDGR